MQSTSQNQSPRPRLRRRNDNVWDWKEVKALLDNFPEEVREKFYAFNVAEQETFLNLMENPDSMPEMFSLDFKETPVHPEIFFTEEYFVGPDLIWNEKEKRGLYPLWKDELCKVLDPDNNVYEWIISGGLGSGKSTVGFLSQVYNLYWLNCLRDPHAYLGLLPSAPIELFLFNINLETVEDVGVNRLERIINQSPYFRENFPVNRRRRKRGMRGRDDWDYKLEFPPYIEITQGSRESHFISRDILGGVLDEANFIPQPKKTGALNYDSSSRAFNLYVGLRNRIESRFMRAGKIHGLLVLISSAATRFDFLEQHKKKQRSNEHVHISEFAIYDIKPWEYSGKKFFVLLGTEHANSRIIPKEEVEKEEKAGEKIIEVPVEHMESYKRDLPRALKEVSGIPSEVISPLFPIREQIFDTIDPKRQHPFIQENFTIGHLSKTQINEYLRPELLARWEGKKLVPINYRFSPRYIHIDLSATQCATGISMGCVSDIRESVVTGPSSIMTSGRAPVIWFDFILQIVPPRPPEEIGYAQIRNFIKYLRDVLNFPIAKVTFDGFQSFDSIQILQNEGFEADLLSVDKKPDPYLTLKAAVIENRVIRYKYLPLDNELIHLQLIQEGPKAYIEKPVGCFVGDTRIPLLNGTNPRIEELVDKEVWVYSCTPTGKMVPGRAKGVFTKYVNKLVDVVLDNDAVIRCTPEHLFMLRNGNYKEARLLIPGVDRLMPLKREFRNYESIGRKGNNRILTHREVYKYFNGEIPDGCVIHHRDGVKINNTPENLECLKQNDHSRLESKLRHEDDWYTKTTTGKMIQFNRTEEGRKIRRKAWEDNLKNLDHWKSKHCRIDINAESIIDASNQFGTVSCDAIMKILNCGRGTIYRAIRQSGYSGWNEFRELLLLKDHKEQNHKVRQVIEINVESVPVYDLQVECWHNFLVGGVFVHNSFKDVSDSFCGVVHHCTESVMKMTDDEINNILRILRNG